MNDRLNLLRLNKKKTKVFVITGVNLMHIIDTKTMLELSQFQLFEHTLDFDISYNDTMLISTHYGD